MKESLECDQTNRMLDSALLLLFESDKHNDNLLRDHVYFAESHILNMGSFVEGKQAYSPTLFMLQVGLTEKPHQFVLK